MSISCITFLCVINDVDLIHREESWRAILNRLFGELFTDIHPVRTRFFKVNER